MVDKFFTGKRKLYGLARRKIYKTVTIGTQTWFAENLAYLPSVTGGAVKGGFWVYDYEGTDVNAAKLTLNYQIYGVLYDLENAKTSCPTGWHLPSNAEFTTLTDYLGGVDVAGGKMKETGTTHWDSPNKGATNESGFSALPAGKKNYIRYILIGEKAFNLIGRVAYFWTSSVDDDY